MSREITRLDWSVPAEAETTVPSSEPDALPPMTPRRRAGAIERPDWNKAEISEDDASLPIFANLTPEAASELDAGFEGLSDATQEAVRDVLAVGQTQGIEPWTQERLDEFVLGDDAGPTLVAFWGDEAAWKIAIASERLHQIADKLSAEETETALNWFDDLPSQARINCLAHLAA